MISPSLTSARTSTDTTRFKVISQENQEKIERILDEFEQLDNKRVLLKSRISLLENLNEQFNIQISDFKDQLAYIQSIIEYYISEV
ncbi:MAG: hypothetical protein ACNS62_17005 [Candidatus Cyclobacteriaceae bacterium M3_2C_046]